MGNKYTTNQIAHFVCVAIKDSDFKWLSFVQGGEYIVHAIKYSNGETDPTHVACTGTFKNKQGGFEYRKICVSKILCKEFLKLKSDELSTPTIDPSN